MFSTGRLAQVTSKMDENKVRIHGISMEEQTWTSSMIDNSSLCGGVESAAETQIIIIIIIVIITVKYLYSALSESSKELFNYLKINCL